MKVQGIVQNTTQWLEWRNSGVTATDAAKIMTERNSIVDLYLRKTQGKDYIDKSKQTFDAVERMEWGHRIEPLLIDKLIEMHPEFSQVQRGTLYQTEWRLASLDGECIDSDRNPIVIECKTSSSIEKWFTPTLLPTVPNSYLYQAMWQMRVTGYKKVIFSVLVGGNQWLERTVLYDINLANAIESNCEQFYHCMVKCTPPEPKTEEDVRLLYTSPTLWTKDPIDAPDLSERWNKISADMKTLTEQKNQLMTEIYERIANRPKLLDGHGKVFARWSLYRKNPIALDTGFLRLKFPEVYDQCLRTSKPTYVLRVFKTEGI